MTVYLLEFVTIVEGYHLRRTISIYKDFEKAENEKNRLNEKLGYKNGVLNKNSYYLVWSYELEEK